MKRKQSLRQTRTAVVSWLVATAVVPLSLAGCLNSAGNETSPVTSVGPSNTRPSEISLGSQFIQLTAAQGAIVVDRKPLRMRFLNANGQTVLAQAANAGGALEPGLAFDEPLGSDYVPDRLLHAPFTYLVGAEASPQVRATPWVGNHITQAYVGIQYHGTEVKKAEALADGLHLEIATNDPSGRIIKAVIKPDAAGSFHVSAEVSPTDGVQFIADSFALQADEAFFGFGGRHNAINQRGKSMSNFIQAQNVGAGPLGGVAGILSGGGDRFMFPSGEDAAYYISTAFASSAGYGFLLDSSKPSRYNMGAASPDAWQVTNMGPSLSYLVTPGDSSSTLKNLSELQGRHRVPHPDDLGPTLSRAVRVLSPEADNASTYEAKVRDDLAKIDAFKLPVKGYAFEGWEILPRETSKEMINMLHARNIRAYLYIRNYVGLDPANTERPETFTEALQNGYVTTDVTGAPYLFGTPFGGVGAAIDFTNPEAVAWWNGRITEMLVDLQADGFMQDFGEHIAMDMQFSDGSTGLTMHNHYPTLFHQTTRKVVDGIEAATGRRIFFWTRAGFASRNGSSAFESANFPGDETSDWSRASGIASLTTDMLSRSATGSYGYNTDIGGYFDYHTGALGAELFTRWSYWAALSPVFRVHNSSSNGVRMPWFFGDETLAHWTKAAKLHQAASPLIMQLWKEAQTTGIPPTRGLWFHYPDDPRARSEDQQWMLGPDVLVAPVVEQGATTRKVYLPQGCWRHVDGNKTYQGPKEVTVPAPIDSLPYFFKCGTKPF